MTVDLHKVYEQVQARREEVVQCAMEILRPFPHCKRGELRGHAIHFLFDCDGIFLHYEKVLGYDYEDLHNLICNDGTDEEIHRALEKIDCELYAEAARRLGYKEVAEELDRVAEQGL